MILKKIEHGLVTLILDATDCKMLSTVCKASLETLNQDSKTLCLIEAMQVAFEVLSTNAHYSCSIPPDMRYKIEQDMASIH